MSHAFIIARKLKPLIFVLCLLPFFWMLYEVVLAQHLLGADPAKTLVNQSGLWAIKAILLALAVTPLRLITQQSYLLIYRRMIGLFAFFYALLHFLIYAILLLNLDFSQVAHELSKRPYIVVGFLALCAYIPLVVTSTHQWQKRLKRRWVKLHRLVYIIGFLAVIHFTWLKKLGLGSTWPYAIILLLLLGIRIVHYIKTKHQISAYK